jgi:alpha-ketoglutarate-dependent 2,4-dichlorophenoxyacetate dioxygenase
MPPLTFKPLHPTFAAEIEGADFSRPDDPALGAAILNGIERYGVLIFRDTGLDNARHVAFSRMFGELEMAPKLMGDKQLPRFDHPELFDAGNLTLEGEISRDPMRHVFNKGNMLWHTDSSFNPRRSSFSLLLAHQTPPEGGDTEFADARTAYEALPEAKKAEIEDLVIEHWFWRSRMLAGFPEPNAFQRQAKPPARHRLVQKHGDRKTLFLAAHADSVVGWPLEEGRALIAELLDFVSQPQFVYRFQWKGPGDMVMWDNRCTLHRATPFDADKYRRDMRRTTVYENVA